MMMDNNLEIQQPTIQLVMPRFFIRSFTNDKEKAKQYFTVAKSEENHSKTLIIRKLVLSKSLKLYGDNSKIIKQFKSYYLFEQRFSIKINTLKVVMSTLNKHNI